MTKAARRARELVAGLIEWEIGAADGEAWNLAVAEFGEDVMRREMIKLHRLMVGK